MPGCNSRKWHPQAESNHQQKFRKLPLYPFNYGGLFMVVPGTSIILTQGNLPGKSEKISKSPYTRCGARV